MENNVLRQRRKSLNLTIYDIAQKTGVSHSTVSRVENGVQGVSVDSARNLAKAYDMALDDFLDAVADARKRRDEWEAEVEENGQKLSQLVDDERKKKDEKYESSVFLMGFDTELADEDAEREALADEDEDADDGEGNDDRCRGW